MSNQHSDLIRLLIALRFAVGYIGEKGQRGWWQSSFFTPGASMFLTPVFTKTPTLAQLTGVTAAAALAHDERIGVGRVYHLFRLPAAIEQEIFVAARDLDSTPAASSGLNPLRPGREPDDAVAYLQAHAETVPADAVGPTRIGDRRSLETPATWSAAAACYLHWLATKSPVYPYFSEPSA